MRDLLSFYKILFFVFFFSLGTRGQSPRIIFFSQSARPCDLFLYAVHIYSVNYIAQNLNCYYFLDRVGSTLCTYIHTYICIYLRGRRVQCRVLCNH